MPKQWMRGRGERSARCLLALAAGRRVEEGEGHHDEHGDDGEEQGPLMDGGPTLVVAEVAEAGAHVGDEELITCVHM